MLRSMTSVLVLALAPLLAGCSGPTVFDACPAIGWLNDFEVALTGPRADEVAVVQFCDEAECSAPSPAGSTPPPTVSVYGARGVGDLAWRIDLGMSAPEEFELIAYAADGSELARQTFTAEWHRTGGTERCGGPMTTDPVEFEVD